MKIDLLMVLPVRETFIRSEVKKIHIQVRQKYQCLLLACLRANLQEHFKKSPRECGFVSTFLDLCTGAHPGLEFSDNLGNKKALVDLIVVIEGYKECWM